VKFILSNVHPGFFPQWVKLMDLLFPQMQFIVTAPYQTEWFLPSELLTKSHEITARPNQSEKTQTMLPPETILLVNVDSRLQI